MASLPLGECPGESGVQGNGSYPEHHMELTGHVLSCWWHRCWYGNDFRGPLMNFLKNIYYIHIKSILEKRELAQETPHSVDVITLDEAELGQK